MSESTKVSVTLSKPSDWWDWYTQVEDIATERNVWDYLDPNNEINAPTPPPQPNPRNLGISSVNMLMDVAEWNLIISQNEEIYIYNKRKKIFDNVEKYLMTIQSFILLSIPQMEHRGVIYGMPAAQIIY